MVPIHDTDVAEERWSQAEWENFELWEKVELRQRRRQRFWILGTLVLFLILSAIPVVMDRRLKWITRSVAVELAQQINLLKREAGSNRAAYRLRLTQPNSLEYIVEKFPNCSTQLGGSWVRSGVLGGRFGLGQAVWIEQSLGVDLGIPGMIREFCYDHLEGSGLALDDQTVSGFGIIPAKDLTEKNLERVTVLLLSGISGEMSFD